MKFNWGHGIFIFYLLFVGVLLTALISSFGVDHDLVVDDYYAQDLQYQSQYDKTMNAVRSDALHIEQGPDQQIILHIKSTHEISGTAYMYRASDKSADFQVNIVDDKTLINTKHLLKGKWTVKVEWKDGDDVYYSEKPLYVT